MFFFSGGGVQVSIPSMCRLGSGSTRPEVKSAPKSALRHCTKISCAASDGDFCSIHPGAKTLVSLHICAGVVTGQCNSRDRRDVTALATQVNKCTAVV